MTHRIAPGLLLAVALGCGDLGPTPTERVLASQKKEEILPYADPYADGSQLAKEREALAGACQKGVDKMAALPTKIRLEKEDKDALKALNESLAAACGKDDSDLAAFVGAFGDVAVKSLNMANDFRGRSISVDLFTGKEDPAKAKNEAAMTEYANAFEAVGYMAFDQVLSFLFYAPLPQRKQALTAAIEFYPRLPPDYEETFLRKHLGKAWSLEGDAELKKGLCDQVYGKARCDDLKQKGMMQ